MDNRKVFAILAAVMMLGVAGMISFDSEESDATTGVNGQFKVFVDNGSGWESPVTCTGYNAFLAVKNYCNIKGTTVVADEAFTTTQGSGLNTYTMVNGNYGKITSLGAEVEGKVWHTFVKTENGWVEPIFGLGCYKPYTDYQEKYRTANVALFCGSSTTTAPTSMPDDILLQAYTPVTESNDFKVTFKIQLKNNNYKGILNSNIDLGELKNTGITLTGYGSDAALALKDAIKTPSTVDIDLNVDVTDSFFNGSGYGFVKAIFGIENGEVQGFFGKKNCHWQLIQPDDNNKKSDFMLGFYSPLDVSGIGSQYHENNFNLNYVSGWM